MSLYYVQKFLYELNRDERLQDASPILDCCSISA